MEAMTKQEAANIIKQALLVMYCETGNILKAWEVIEKELKTDV
jgi:hypothetical protein